MSWPIYSADAFPVLAVISPLIGIGSLILMGRSHPRLIQVLAVSNATITLLMMVASAAAVAAGTPVKYGFAMTWLALSGGGGLPLRLGLELSPLSVWPALLLAIVTFSGLCLLNFTDRGLTRLCVGLLALESLLLAALFSTDAVMSLLLAELATVPVWVLVGTLGDANRRSAAASWWITQALGASITLLGLTVLAVSVPWMQSDFVPRRGEFVFDTARLVERIQTLLARTETAWSVWDDVAPWVAGLLGLGLMIRLPVFPFVQGSSEILQSGPASVGMVVAVAFPSIGILTWLRLAEPLFHEPSAARTLMGLAALAGAIQAAGSLSVARDLRQIIAGLSGVLLGLACFALSLPSRDGPRAAWMLVLVQGVIVAVGLLLVQVNESARARAAAGDPTADGEVPGWRFAVTLFLAGWVAVPSLLAFVPMILLFSAALSAGILAFLGVIGVQLMLARSLLEQTLQWRRYAVSTSDTAKAASDPGRRRFPWREFVALTPLLSFLLGVMVAPTVVLDVLDRREGTPQVRSEASAESRIDGSVPVSGTPVEDSSDG